MSPGRAAGLLAPALCLLWAAPAGAATATLLYEEPIPGLEPEPAYALSVEAAAGEANALTVAQDEGGYTVRDSGAPLHAGPGCEPAAAGEVRCPTRLPADAHSAFVGAGDRGDRVSIEGLPSTTFAEVLGGPGADSILGGPGADLLHGGSGPDVIAAGEGHDRLDGGRGDDRLDGGLGRDRVIYETRSAPVRVDLAIGAGGEAGERDELVSVEEILGGRGSDTLAGDGIDNVIIGGPGDGRDTVAGRGGNDTLVGHRASGGSGDDSVGGRVVSCGSGHDVVSRGPGRWLRGPFPRDCETVLAIFVTIAPDPVARSARRAVFGLACRAPRCRGTLELRDRRGRLGFRRFALRQAADPDALRRVSVRLSRAPAARVAKLRVRGDRAYQRDWFRTRLR